MLDLRAIEGGIDLKPGNDVGTEQYFVSFANVMKLDGEAVGGSVYFFFRHQQGRGVTFLLPPPKYRFGSPEFAGGKIPQDTQHVVVGKLLVVVTGGGGAIQND